MLKVHELIVVDAKGTERVRISGAMPNAVINGQELIRGSAAAVIMLYDKDGVERGGYITFDNDHVALTFDSKQKQTALFVAGPTGATALQIGADNSMLELRSDPDGSRLTVSKAGKVILQHPDNIPVGVELCAEYRSLTQKYAVSEVLSNCNKRFNESACNTCFAGLK